MKPDPHDPRRHTLRLRPGETFTGRVLVSADGDTAGISAAAAAAGGLPSLADGDTPLAEIPIERLPPHVGGQGRPDYSPPASASQSNAALPGSLQDASGSVVGFVLGVVCGSAFMGTIWALTCWNR